MILISHNRRTSCYMVHVGSRPRGDDSGRACSSTKTIATQEHCRAFLYSCKDNRISQNSLFFSTLVMLVSLPTASENNCPSFTDNGHVILTVKLRSLSERCSFAHPYDCAPRFRTQIPPTLPPKFLPAHFAATGG